MPQNYLLRSVSWSRPMISKPRRLERALKLVTLVVLVAGAVAMACMSGMWRNLAEPQGLVGLLFVCAPLLLFGVAAALGRQAGPLLLILGAAVFAIILGLAYYYDAFWSNHRSDVSGLALLFVPAVQGVIGVIALVFAFIDRRDYRRRQRAAAGTSETAFSPAARPGGNAGRGE